MFNKLTKKTLLLIASLCFVGTLNAADLDGSKKAGQVGEQSDGYVGLVSSGAPSDVAAMVKEVNAKRKAVYADIAKKNNININDVAKLTGKKQIDKARAGEYVQIGGQWKKK